MTQGTQLNTLIVRQIFMYKLVCLSLLFTYDRLLLHKHLCTYHVRLPTLCVDTAVDTPPEIIL